MAATTRIRMAGRIRPTRGLFRRTDGAASNAKSDGNGKRCLSPIISVLVAFERSNRARKQHQNAHPTGRLCATLYFSRHRGGPPCEPLVFQDWVRPVRARGGVPMKQVIGV